MAGIGFKLAHMAQERGVFGIAGAATLGGGVSAGPWIMMVAGVNALQSWASRHLGAADQASLSAVVTYAFSFSALAAAAIANVTTRLAADLLFARRRSGMPNVLAVTSAIGMTVALLLGAVVFGPAGAGLPPLEGMLAATALALLTLLWIVTPLLTALQHYWAILICFLGGIVVSGSCLELLVPQTVGGALVALVAGALASLAAVLQAISREFPAHAGGERGIELTPRNTILPSLAGLAGTLALWSDKWVLWFGPGSVRALGSLRLNPLNDFGSFLGLLTMVPGLTLLLIASETRFDRTFRNFLARCTGTSTYRRIEAARHVLVDTIMDDFRLLITVQSLVAAVAWVFAVPLFDYLEADPRGIFAFRQTALGAVCHLVALQMTLVLSYYDLFGRICVIWGGFAAASILATLAAWPLGFAGFGWGYLVGALVGATIAIALTWEATGKLTFLLFVGNNPSIVGSMRRWL